jgi:phenylacetate-CoA ligase
MSGLRTALTAHVLFPLHERAKRHDSVARRRALERSQWWTPEQLAAHRVRALREFLIHIGAHVPYYRKRFAELGLKPERFGALAELAAYPLLSRAEIRAEMRGASEAFRSDVAGPLKRLNTGGSTGEPLVFYVGRDRVSHDVAAKWRATRWWGVDIGDPEIVVWGSPVELGAQDRMRQWRDKLLRSELLPAFDMSERSLERYVARIRTLRPAMLFGYPSSLSMIAAFADKRGQPMNDLGIRVAFVTSERLYDHQRALIERVFGCPVANGYGGRDAGFLAHQCPAGGMHLTAEDIIVETVDAQGVPVAPGVSGEIVVTHLASRDFPFLRYRTGDLGVLDTKRCSCGRGLPLLSEIQGRTTDFVLAADGTAMHALALIYVIRDLPGIERYKIVQESRALTRVLIVPGAQFDAAVRAKIEAGLKQRLGAAVEIRIETVADIPAERSGKFKYVVSHVAPVPA